MKCFGYGLNGLLGCENSSNRWDGNEEVVNLLPLVDFDVNVRISQLSLPLQLPDHVEKGRDQLLWST